MKSTLLLAAQAIFAIFGLRQLVRNVLPELPRLQHPQVILDIWVPMAVVGPMLFLIGRTSPDIAGSGWLALGGPLLLAMIGMGFALIRADTVGSFGSFGQARNSPAAAAIAGAGAGLLMLLLGAAHDMTMWVGQCAFAIGAVLLWINTPSDSVVRTHSMNSQPHDRRAGLGMAAMASCAIVQGHVMMNLHGPLTFISTAMALTYGVFALAFTARIAGPQACARVGLWAAALGIFLGLGLISISHLIPEALHILRFGYGEPVNKIASGFGMLAPEAAGLIVVAGLAIAMPWLRNRMSLFLGLLVVGAGLAAVVVRLLMSRP